MYLNNKESAEADPNQHNYSTLTDVLNDISGFIENLNTDRNKTGIEDYTKYTIRRFYVHNFDDFYRLSDGYVIRIITSQYPYKAFIHDDHIEVYTHLTGRGLSNIKDTLSKEEYEVIS